MIKLRWSHFLLVLGCFFVAPLLNAQIIFGERPSVAGKLVIQNWKLANTITGHDTSLTQVSFPFSVFMPVSVGWEIHFNGSISHSSLDNSRASTSVSSLGSSTIRIYHSFADNRLFAAGGVILPTGKTQYDTLQATLAQLVADDYLNVPIKQLGSGAGFLVQAGGVSQYEWLLLGASLGYTYTGSYKYLKDGDDYNPGDVISIQGSATASSTQASAGLDIGYDFYTADQVKGKDIFKSGGVLSLILSGKYNFTNTQVNLSIGQIIRSKNSLQFGNTLQSEDKKSRGDKTIISGAIAYLFTKQLNMSVLTEYRHLSANQYSATSSQYFGNSKLFSFGVGGQYTLPGDKYILFAKLLFDTGDANTGNSDVRKISVSGTEISVGGRIRF